MLESARRLPPPSAPAAGSGAVVRSGRGYELVKASLDRLGAAALLVASAPIVAAAAAAIVLDDGRPILYRRQVLGLGGRPFVAYKLRTMRVDADAWLASRPELRARYERNVKLRHDPRVTRVGRVLRALSIDELPQLVNVLRGEMSLVGPRMLHPSELGRYGDFAAARLSVKPGLTGLWQVSGRQELDYAARIALDRRYLEQRSLGLDLRILLATVPAVLGARGAH